jgi:hypothetical protein
MKYRIFMTSRYLIISLSRRDTTLQILGTAYRDPVVANKSCSALYPSGLRGGRFH